MPNYFLTRGYRKKPLQIAALELQGAVAAASGDTNNTAKAYKAFLAAWPDADGNLAQITLAGAWPLSH
jgi:hypothetical protein